MNRGLDDVLLDGALPYAVQGSNIFLLHILESEQNKNLTGELAQFLEGPQHIRKGVLTQ